MVKKIKKYAKFVVCMALIMGLIAPSYAALSASDGSAFVTKAEFDSALADFNARLTTFEAGINSKIDSQVTSYLDRNGIWNGKTQTMIDCYGVMLSQKLVVNHNNSAITSNANGMIGTKYLQVVKSDGSYYNNSDADKIKIIDTVSKSGLLCLQFNYTQNFLIEGWLDAWFTGGSRNPAMPKNYPIGIIDGTKIIRFEVNGNWTFTGNNDNTRYHLQGMKTYTNYLAQTIDFVQSNGVVLGTKVYSWNGQALTAVQDSAYTSAEPAQLQTYYFFVTKGEPLWLTWRFNCVDVWLNVQNEIACDRGYIQCCSKFKASVY